MSLRSRLVVASVVLVALGLLAADAATFGLLRSSLIARVDEQLGGAGLLATRALFDQGDFGFPPDFPGIRRRRTLPPVAFAELLDSSGTVVAVRSFGFGVPSARPELPPDLPGSSGQGTAARILTVGSTVGSLRYRVLATALPDGHGTVVVAFPLGDVDATLRRLVLVEGLVTVLVLGAVVMLALWLVEVGLRPLRQIEHATADIAAGDLSRRVPAGNDRTEVGRLARALNVMLARIESAFAEKQASEDRLRRFVADASHELRTPLTSIRGYAELFRHGAGERPDDLAKSMRRIEEESARMGTLVEEMLLLARLDQGRPLEMGAVDLAAIARDAVEDARVVAPDRAIDLVQPDSVLIQGDDARLRQVVGNLMTNALTHTPAGTPVHVRLERKENGAILEVADEGPGLEPDHAARAFDRFFRADPARARADGGAGLGLAIVAAIVHAHGGTVSVETAPGAGARFTVTLPLP